MPSKYGSRSPHSSGIEPREAVEVEVRDRRRRLVAVPDREGRARDRLGDAERPRGAADERRLAGAELAGDGDDVARPRASPRGAPRAPRSPPASAVDDLHGVAGRLEEAELDRLLGWRRRGRRLGSTDVGRLERAAEQLGDAGAKSSSSTCSIRGV